MAFTIVVPTIQSLAYTALYGHVYTYATTACNPLFVKNNYRQYILHSTCAPWDPGVLPIISHVGPEH
jgi:hypothetical protein